MELRRKKTEIAMRKDRKHTGERKKIKSKKFEGG